MIPVLRTLRDAFTATWLAPAIEKAAPGQNRDACIEGARKIEASVWNKLPLPQTYGRVYVADMMRSIQEQDKHAFIYEWLYLNRETLEQVTADDAFPILAEFLLLRQQVVPLIQKCDGIRQSIEPLAQARNALSTATAKVEKCFAQMVDACGTQETAAFESKWQEALSFQRQAFQNFRSLSSGGSGIKAAIDEYATTRNQIAVSIYRLRKLSFALRYEFPVCFGHQAHRLLLRSHNLLDFPDFSIPKALVVATPAATAAVVVVENGTDEVGGSSTKRAKTNP